MSLIELDVVERAAIIQRACDLSLAGLSCSESIVRALGDSVLMNCPDELCRAATPFSGSVGGIETCGALTGGLMIIGALYGRLEPNESRALCKRISHVYRKTFLESFGQSQCIALKQEGWGAPNKPCGDLIGESAKMLLEILTKAEQ